MLRILIVASISVVLLLDPGAPLDDEGNADCLGISRAGPEATSRSHQAYLELGVRERQDLLRDEAELVDMPTTQWLMAAYAHEPDSEVRETLLHLIGDRRRPCPAQRRLLLEELALDGPPPLRSQAIVSLGYLGERDAIPLLRTILSEDLRGPLAGPAVLSLGMLGAHEACDELISYFRAWQTSPDGSWGDMGRRLRALMTARCKAAVPLLLDLLESPEHHGLDELDEEDVVWVLRWLPDPESGPLLLRKYLQHRSAGYDMHDLCYQMLALGTSRCEEARAVLIADLQECEREGQVDGWEPHEGCLCYVMALAIMHEPSVLEAFLSALADPSEGPSPNSRKEMEETVAALSGYPQTIIQSQIIPAICRMDSNPPLRDALLEALDPRGEACRPVGERAGVEAPRRHVE